jgi:hypothetical protein
VGGAMADGIGSKADARFIQTSTAATTLREKYSQQPLMAQG